MPPPPSSARARRPVQPYSKERYVNARFSFFGVGSKAAGFFVGQTVRMITRQANDAFVRDVHLDVPTMSARRINGRPTFEGSDLHERLPNAIGDLSPMEQL